MKTYLFAVIKKTFDKLATLDIGNVFVRQLSSNRLPATPSVINRHLLVALAIANNNGTHRFPMSDGMMLDVFIAEFFCHIEYNNKKSA